MIVKGVSCDWISGRCSVGAHVRDALSMVLKCLVSPMWLGSDVSCVSSARYACVCAFSLLVVCLEWCSAGPISCSVVPVCLVRVVLSQFPASWFSLCCMCWVVCVCNWWSG